MNHRLRPLSRLACVCFSIAVPRNRNARSRVLPGRVTGPSVIVSDAPPGTHIRGCCSIRLHRHFAMPLMRMLAQTSPSLAVPTAVVIVRPARAPGPEGCWPPIPPRV